MTYLPMAGIQETYIYTDVPVTPRQPTPAGSSGDSYVMTGRIDWVALLRCATSIFGCQNLKTISGYVIITERIADFALCRQAVKYSKDFFSTVLFSSHPVEPPW